MHQRPVCRPTALGISEHCFFSAGSEPYLLEHKVDPIVTLLAANGPCVVAVAYMTDIQQRSRMHQALEVTGWSRHRTVQATDGRSRDPKRLMTLAYA